MSHPLAVTPLPQRQLAAAPPGYLEGVQSVEDLTSHPAASSAAETSAGPLTPAAELVISLLPDTRCRAPDQGRNKLIRIFMSCLARSRGNS
jgi:hypothetical protein